MSSSRQWKLGTQSDWLFVGELPCLESKLYRYPLFLGIASLSFEGVGAMALPIENSMANPVKFPNVSLGIWCLLFEGRKDQQNIMSYLRETYE